MAHSDTSIPESELPSAEPVAWLVYKFAANGGVVFDTVEQAIYDETVQGALAEAKTWGELRRFLPKGEWEAIEERLLEAVDYDLEDQKHLWELDETPFDASQIPGYCDGDYPRWAQQSMDEVIPEDLLKTYGVQETSIHNGLFWLIPHDQAEALVDALRLRGYHVEHTPFLRGW